MSAKHTPGPWRLGTDAQGPCMVLHPTREGVAIANLGASFLPANGYHDDWMIYREDGKLDVPASDARIAERNANANLIAAAPELFAALQAMLAAGEYHYRMTGWPARFHNGALGRARAAIAKATTTP